MATRRKKQMVSIGDALGADTESSAFGSTDTLTANPDEMLDNGEDFERPEKDMGSETSGFAGIDTASELERVLSEEAKDDRLALYETLSPKAKELFLATYQTDPLANTMQHDPLYIDKASVPDKIVLQWISRWVASEIGWRGFLPVPNDDRARKWAPNLRVHSSQRYVMSGRMVLSFKSKAEWLTERLRELKESNATREESLKSFAPALKSRYAELGITKAEAESLDKQLGGVVRSRGPDPLNSTEPDMTRGDGE